MDKIRENLLKAIEEKTNAYQRLSVKDILDLSQACKNIYDMGKTFEFNKDGITISKGNFPTITNFSDVKDGAIVGFCD